MKGRRAQGSVAGIIFLIAIFIVLFVLILPPCDKCKLLGDECPDYCDEVDVEDSEVLLSESPGSVSPFGLNESTEEFDQINLFFDPDPYTKRLDTSFDISTSWFSDSDKVLSFDVDDLDNIDSAHLLLDIIDSKGKLIIELNDHQIFHEKISSPSMKMVELPMAYLQEKNVLRIFSDGPGLAFWERNYYEIREAILKIEFNKISAKSIQNFYVSSNEKDNLLGSRLEFFIYCDEEMEDFTVFKIFLNDHLVNNEFLDCEGVDRAIALNREYVEKSSNELVFVIDSGKYILSQPKVINSFVSNVQPYYEFNIDDEVYENYNEIYLKLEFPENGRKKAEIKINDYTFELDTSAEEFEINIGDYVEEGENTVEIIPENSFEIEKLKVWYE